MATVEYDLDTSGGLMEQIQKLVAPPSSDEITRRPRRRERGEYRRHGRAVNHDCCDSCKEGGDLLCCDRCPAAFHLLCHDPPLEEDDLPSGEWICHRCRITPNPEIKEGGVVSSSTSTASKPSTSRSRGRRRSQEEPMEVEEPSHPLQILAKAAHLMNPVQFDLPKDIACTTSLPGSSKRRWGRENSRGPPKKVPHELDNAMVMLPAKLCFVCNRSCRKSALLQCDYCPLLFHMDCLSPPLTTMPSGRWMCPNHPENCLDEAMLKSIGLSERVKLWDHYTTGQMNQHAVKLNFLKKIHRQSPPFRIKVKHSKRTSIAVPKAIKDQYACPPALLPPPCSRTIAGKDDLWMGSSTYAASLEDQEEWLSSVVSLQTSIAKYLAQKQLNKSPSAAASTCSTPLSNTDLFKTVELSKPTASVSPVIHRENSLMDSSSHLPPYCVGDLSTGSVTPGGDSKDNQCETERTATNGPASSAALCDSPDSMISFANGPPVIDLIKPGVSLLNHSPHPPNGDIDSRPGFHLSNPETIVVKTRSNSLDSAPVNVVKVTWPPGERPGSSLYVGSSSSGSPSVSQGKNIVISAINKANNTLVTKVISNSPSQLGKTLPNSAAVKPLTSGNHAGTSILSPRSGGQSIVRTGNILSKLNTAGSAAMTTISRVVTVPNQGLKSSASNNGSNTPLTKVTPVNSLSNSPAIANLNSTLQSCIEGNGETELSKLDDRLIQILAWQRLQQLLPSKPSATPKKGLLNGLLSQQGSTEVQARALLCPLTGKGQPIPMPYRSLHIGTGADMDVCLHNFGSCSYISSKHATIFYDEMSKHFELLNYSEHGTTVDNVLYSCDFSEKATVPQQSTSAVAAVREVIKKGKKKKMEEKQKIVERDRMTMSGHANEVHKLCNCKGSSSSLIGGSGAGWEGTALLHHGSYIKVGCLQFVFSIVEQASQESTLDRRREPTSLLKPPFRSTVKSEF